MTSRNYKFYLKLSILFNVCLLLVIFFIPSRLILKSPSSSQQHQPSSEVTEGSASTEEPPDALSPVVEAVHFGQKRVKNLFDTNKNIVTLSMTVCHSELKMDQVVNLLKSAIFASAPGLNLRVILFVDAYIYLRLQDKTKEVEEMATKFKINLNIVVKHTWFRGVDDEVKDMWEKKYKPCATQKLFLTSRLPEVDSVIYLDTDILFLSNVQNLWDIFDKMDDHQMVAMASSSQPSGNGWYNLHATIPYFGSRGLNAGVMLMNLTRLRQIEFENQVDLIYDAYQGDIEYADQDILNIFFHFFPLYVYELSCDFNFRAYHCACQSCRCAEAEKGGISIVHGLGRVFEARKKSQDFQLFRNIYRAFENFDWRMENQAKLLQKLQDDYNALDDGREEFGDTPDKCFLPGLGEKLFSKMGQK